MKRRGSTTAVVLAGLAVGGCGGGRTARPVASDVGPPAREAASHARRSPVQSPQALVTDETENRLLVVDLPSGRLARRLELPADPEDIAASASGGVAVVVSSRAGVVTVLGRRTLRRLKSFGGFDEPHIVALSPDRTHAYVTDDARGTLTVLRLSDMRTTSTVDVGTGAHHLTMSPDQHQLWVGLGESASRIVILTTADLDRPRVVGDFSPGFSAHDLSFSPDGRQVWVSSSSTDYVTAFDARGHHRRFRVFVGAPPQHIAFAGRYAYLTSGYGSVIEKVDAATGRVLRRSASPYGSFELSVADGYVATSSLLRGTLAIYTPALELRRVVTLAPATREVAISRP